MDGQVTDTQGAPIASALVEVWHANSLGNYSYFDKSQSAFNLRRTIVTDAEDATASAASCRPATAARPTVRRRSS